MLDISTGQFSTILHDNKVQHPLGGGSYVFKTGYIDYITSQVTKPDIKISIGAQPNGSPHFGTLMTFSLAFSLAHELQQRKKNVSVVLELVDTAKDHKQDCSYDGVGYQKSISYTGKIKQHRNDYEELLKKLKSYSGVSYEIRGQTDFNSHEKIPEIIGKLINKREQIGALLSPESKCLALRAACPHCGLADKHGLNNSYDDKMIKFFCHFHGQYSIDFEKEPSKLEYNTPLRNLIKGIVYSEDNKDKNINHAWIRVTGSDYAGTYQEQVLYRGASILGTIASDLPFIVYCPLVTDWSGSKLSKSLYVAGKAYEYLCEQKLDYLIDYSKFQERFDNDGLKKLYQEVSLWLNRPYMLFKSYSIYYFDRLFSKPETLIHQEPVIAGKKLFNLN
ncbi:10059_t:CDS:1 [Cetraspora pellucida]|uniref:10059_t:CDS:1 n=1 Tax=Cetraspora pellucida TaxID=1433469 RepID=A0A9N9NI11_9GLOM|nr:10059_t:CDS:1 [Cetraspora pellucida]